MNLLQETIDLFRNARFAVADAIESLYEVYKAEAWREKYGSWSEFCEDGLQISKSLGSQYVAVYKHYIAEGGLTVKQLREVDIGKVYLALPLKGTPEQQYEKALVLTRNELREEAAVKENGEEHDCIFHEYCNICWRRKD